MSRSVVRMTILTTVHSWPLWLHMGDTNPSNGARFNTTECKFRTSTREMLQMKQPSLQFQHVNIKLHFRQNCLCIRYCCNVFPAQQRFHYHSHSTENPYIEQRVYVYSCLYVTTQLSEEFLMCLGDIFVIPDLQDGCRTSSYRRNDASSVANFHIHLQMFPKGD